MNGDQIKALLDTCIKGGVLTLGPSNPLASPRINQCLATWFGGTLRASVPTVAVGATSVTYPGATLETAGFVLYAAIPEVPAILTFSSGADDKIDMEVAATLPDGYQLGNSFAGIKDQTNNALNQIAFNGATYDVQSAGPPPASFRGTIVTADGLLDSWSWLFGASIAVAGAVAVVADNTGKSQPQFVLVSASIQNIQIAGFSLSLALRLNCQLSRLLGTPPRQALMAWVDIVTALITPALTLPVVISLPAKGLAAYTLSLDTAQPAPKPGNLAALSGFAYGIDPGTALSTDTPIGQLSVDNVSCILGLSPLTLTNFSVTVSLGTNWTIINNLFTLQRLKLVVTVPTLVKNGDPGSQPVPFTVLVAADLTIGTGKLEAFVSYPEKLVGLQLAPGSAIDINAFLAQLAGGATLPGQSGNLSITLFSAVADIGNSTYTLACAATGNLALLANFLLTQISFDVTYTGGKVDQFQFTSNFAIAGAALYLTALQAQGAWTLSGGTDYNQDIDLAALVTDIAGMFGVVLPSNLPPVLLTNLDMSYMTGDGSFAFSAGVQYMSATDPILKKVTGKLDIAYDGTRKTWKGTIAGEIELTSCTLKADFDFGDANVLSVSWTAAPGKEIGVADLCQLVDIAPPQIPPELDIALRQLAGRYDITNQRMVIGVSSTNFGLADLVLWKDQERGWQVFFALSTDKPIDLTAMPLIGPGLSQICKVAVDNITVDLASSVIDAATAQALGALVGGLPGPYPRPPETGLPKNFALAVTFDVNGDKTPLTFGTGATDSRAMLPRARLVELDAGPGDGAKWFQLQKSFGPLTIQKVGLNYKDAKLWVLLNASLTAGGLTIGVQGLGVGSPISTFDPEFTISGVDITFAQGPILVSGGLVGTLSPIDFYGELIIRVPPLSISALGGYAEYQQRPSLFLYATLDYPIGGPPFFFVTGLAAGFGYNRQLIIPDVDGVADFPLVQWAMGNNVPSQNPMGNVGEQVQEALVALADSGIVAPSIGQYWFAAGIKFTSFELVTSFALLTVKFGTDFEVALLGLSRLALPPAGKPVVLAELQLKAMFSPANGLIGISGQLTSNSYVLSPDCHLTGGFAFYVWFAGDHAGDFVITLGGYGPRFPVPAHYPKVPRLGINWKVCSELTISGSEYFALTSSAVMAGGSLSAVWQSGPVRAWFSVEADFLMVFTPFHYYMSGSIQLGASVRINLLFTHFTISIHLGVGIEVWGPEFSGRVKVDLSIVSFTVSFGAAGKGVATTVSWPDFVKQLLPSQSSQGRRALPGATKAAPSGSQTVVVTLAAGQGLLKDLGGEGGIDWVVDPESFQGVVSLAIPAKAAAFTGQVRLAPDAMQPQRDGRPIPPNTAFGCGPVGTNDFQSTVTVTITTVEDSGFLAVRILKPIPTALWQVRSFDSHGNPVGLDPLSNTNLPDGLSGFQLVPVVQPPDHTLPIELSNLQYTIDEKIQKFWWSLPAIPGNDPFTGQTVPGTIASPPATTNRPVLISAIQRTGIPVQPDVDVAVLASVATDYLMAPPVLSLLGANR